MKKLLFTLLSVCLALHVAAGEPVFPVKGICMNPPAPEAVEPFCTFIRNELAPMGVNTLFLRIDYAYEFETYPEMAGKNALSKADIKKIVAVCKQDHIRLIPLVDLLGHQSWAGTPGRLLEVFPEFDETPYIPLPQDPETAKRKPNGLYDGDLYCKSYCPLHPDVHKVVFSLLGEIIDVFETDALHAGMDEVFYLGEYGCPRCHDKDKAQLFADEVNRINSYVKSKDCELWIWGDRLLDGATTGMGMWEAATNGTAPAIDRISKDVVICDWHYERPDLSAVYFAQKGFRVATSPWRKPDVALRQLDNTLLFRQCATPAMKERYIGIVHTDWGSANGFMEEFARVKKGKPSHTNTAANAFYQLFGKIQAMEK